MSPQKPSAAEEEYFAREDAEKKRKLALAHIKQQAAEQQAAASTLHRNHCPACGQKLHELALNGVSVARCFACNGIFLTEANLRRLAGEPGYWERMLHFFVSHDYSKPHA